MRVKTLSLAIACGGLLSSDTVFAAQSYNYNEHEEVTVHASHTDLNRLSVENDRIMKIVFLGDVLDIDKDERLGQIFFLPKLATDDRPIRMTITTEKGKTQDVLIKTKDEAGQTIILKDVQPQEREESTVYSTQHTVRSSMGPVAVITSVIQGRTPVGFTKSTSEEGEGFIRYKGPRFDIVGFTFHNDTTKAITLHENEFQTGPQVLAIAIEHKQLEPNELTTIYKAVSHD